MILGGLRCNSHVRTRIRRIGVLDALIIWEGRPRTPAFHQQVYEGSFFLFTRLSHTLKKDGRALYGSCLPAQ